MDTMSGPAAALAGRLARDAEAVCRHYLSNGRRSGRYWLVGDVANTPGRSLFVRLTGPANGPGAAGHWSDAATGQHGDLLDLIGLACDFGRLQDTIAEAKRFLGGVPAAPLRRPARGCTARLGRGRTAPVRRRATGHRDAGRDLPARARYHGLSVAGTAALPSGLLLSHRSRGGRHFRPDLARAVVRCHRSVRTHHRPAADLARPRRFGQGAGRNAAPGNGRSARSWRAVRFSRRHPGRGRGHRDDAGVALGAAGPALRRGTLGQPSWRIVSAGRPLSPLRRAGRRPRWPSRCRAPDGARGSGGVRCLAAAADLR